MQKKCDLYFGEPVRSDLLRPLNLFDQSFTFNPEKAYAGFLYVNVDRVKLVSLVLTLRRSNISCFSVPIEYRDRRNIQADEALSVAMEYARARSASVSTVPTVGAYLPPVVWGFDLTRDGADEKAGGMVMVDRLDGHVWNSAEYEEYMYDFNNVI